MQVHKECIPFVYKDSVNWSCKFLHCMADIFFQLMESLKSYVTSKIGISLMGCVNYLHCIVGTLEFRRLYRHCSGLSTTGMRIVQLLLPVRLLIYTCDPCVVKVIARRLKQKKSKARAFPVCFCYWICLGPAPE